MKKITIGRGRECDIRIDDSTDKVSRRQAVITISPTGKMKIYDTSSNGTFVNGEKVEKPAGKPVKRGDNVNFAHLADLNWDLVKNPYRRMWQGMTLFLVIVLIIAAVLFFWGDAIFQTARDYNRETVTEQPKDSVAPVNTELKLETPAVTPTPKAVQPSKPKETKGTAPQLNPKAAQEVVKKETEPVKETPAPESSDPALDEMLKDK